MKYFLKMQLALYFIQQAHICVCIQLRRNEKNSIFCTELRDANKQGGKKSEENPFFPWLNEYASCWLSN